MTEKRPGRFQRAWRKVLVAAMVLAVVAPFWLVYRMGTRRSAAIAAAGRDDPNWRLDDLLAHREAVADADNGAIPVAEAAAKLPDPWPPAPTPQQAAGGLALQEAFDRATKAEGPERPDDETLAVLRAELAARGDALAVAREVARFARGRSELVVPPNVLETKYEAAHAARRVARLLQADAIVAACDGRPDDALASCRAMLGVGRAIGDQPGLIPQLVRGAVDRSAVHTILATLAWGEPSADALAKAQRDVLAALAAPIERYALRGERALSFAMFERATADPNVFRGEKDDGEPVSRILLPIWAPFMAWQQVLVLESSNELAAIVERPTPEWLAVVEAWRARMKAREASRVGRITGLFALLLAPTSDSAFDAWMSRRAYLGAAAVLLAAERQRLATGEWPATVAEIDSEILPDPPRDPYTGGPFRMRLADGRLRVYSLGTNLKDEGGDYDLKAWRDKIGRDDVGACAFAPELRGRPAVANDPDDPER